MDIEATTITYNEGTNLRLGTRTASCNGYFESSFNGNLDEVSLWNITLTAEDIQNNMNTSLGGDEDGLAGYWKFDANEGSFTFDHTGNQNHGYIIGATWSDDVPVPGCTDTLATNYNPEANWDDGSCEYLGNYSLSFDGEFDYVSLGGSYVTKPCTAEMWVKRRDNPGWQILLDQPSSYSLRLEQWAAAKKVGYSKASSYDAHFDYINGFIWQLLQQALKGRLTQQNYL